MGNYELDNQGGYFLHYTGDGWATCKITKEEYDYLKKSTKRNDFFKIMTDGREVY